MTRGHGLGNGCPQPRDAHIRHLAVTVASDAVAHIHRDLADAALRMTETHMGARILPAARALN